MKTIRMILMVCVIFIFSNAACRKSKSTTPAPPAPTPISLLSAKFNSVDAVPSSTTYGVNSNAVTKLFFTNKVKRSTVASSVTVNARGVAVPLNFSYENNDSTVVVTPATAYAVITPHTLSITTALQSDAGRMLASASSFNFITAIDSSNKFPLITDDELLTKVQQQTFKYFWDYGHPVSGLARERSNEAPETITSGGSGFGIMAIVTGVHRNFITRAQGLARMQTIVSFLKNTAQKFHGAFPHWLNGTTGVAIPFSQKDNGADIVETSYLMMGLLTARQYFNGTDAAETNLRNDINALWNGVEWNWFRKNNENVLYWHWSPNYNWDMNHAIKGWNECLITYVLAASSTTYSIPKVVYENGWANNGNTPFKNGSSYYNYQLPLGENLGGPLFFSHYSFMGINPNGLSDVYANYQTQTKNHTLINYEYCKANPKQQFGYSSSCWGLTASDIPNGYTASSPTNDVGVIAPTAALSSFPYAPAESMQALKFFYYTLGDKIWKDYGFVDAFSLKEVWFANSYLAIDQGPIIVMIENYRSGLLWNLFTSCPEVKTGMKNVLGFSAPYL